MAFYTGQILITAANYVPAGWYACDGSLHSTTDSELSPDTGKATQAYDPLFGLIWNSFGGDGTTTFAVPDLRDQVPDNMVPIICSDDSTLGSTTSSAFPPPMFDISSDTPFPALVDTYSTDYAPKYWADCNGAAIPMGQNPSLYSLIGNEFGASNKQQTFNLPDLSSLVTFSLAGEIPNVTVESLPFPGSGGVAIATTGVFPDRS